MASPEPETGHAAPLPAPAPVSPVATALWMGHALLRFGVFGYLLVYGWPKLMLMQMGRLDYSAALYAFGEKSPMGLFWNFFAYSPALQFLAGLIEVLAALLLIWRRTVWLGALLGMASMGAVFLLNLLYDIPVGWLALGLALACLVLALPDLPRLGRFLAGRATGAPAVPRPIPWPRVHRITRWPIAGLGLAIVIGPAALVPSVGPTEADSPVAGIYRVAEDSAQPAAQLAGDDRWQAAAFGQYQANNGSLFTVRTADGDLHEGVYRVDGPTVEMDFYPVLEGDRGLVREVEHTVELTWEEHGDGGLRLSGGEQDLVLAPDTELRYLYDRDFSWAPRPVVNR